MNLSLELGRIFDDLIINSPKFVMKNSLAVELAEQT